MAKLKFKKFHGIENCTYSIMVDDLGRPVMEPPNGLFYLRRCNTCNKFYSIRYCGAQNSISLSWTCYHCFPETKIKI